MVVSFRLRPLLLIPALLSALPSLAAEPRPADASLRSLLTKAERLEWWLSLASSQGMVQAREVMPAVEWQTTGEQIAEAQRLAPEFNPQQAPATLF